MEHWNYPDQLPQRPPKNSALKALAFVLVIGWIAAIVLSVGFATAIILRSANPDTGNEGSDFLFSVQQVTPSPEDFEHLTIRNRFAATYLDFSALEETAEVETASLSCENAFGSVYIYVPRGVRVEIEQSDSFFGTLTNKTSEVTANDALPTLRLDIKNTFGFVTISNRNTKGESVFH